MELWAAPKLSGGLGNRLFQLASVKQYANTYKKKIVFLLPTSGKTDHGAFENIFNLFPEIPILETANKWYTYDEKKDGLYEYEELLDKQENVVISGYRQSYKYFTNIAIEPKFENIISKERIEYLNNKYLSNKKDLFFIHIRLGDFCILPHHQINVQKYYSNAIRYIPSDSTVLIFSDDIKMIYNINFISEINNIKCEEKDEIESLYLMSNCLKGGIVANSTFSFWGAYLAKQQSPTFLGYYPNSLGKGLPKPKDYYPEWAIVLDT